MLQNVYISYELSWAFHKPQLTWKLFVPSEIFESKHTSFLEFLKSMVGAL